MESHPYSYGTKLTGLILHLFFTVVLTIAVFLLASMLSKNIFELSDVGTEQFLDSGYYTKCIEKKCDDLSDYLRLLIKGESRTSEGTGVTCNTPMSLRAVIAISAIGTGLVRRGTQISRTRRKDRSLTWKLC